MTKNPSSRKNRIQSIMLAVVLLAIWEGACRLFAISPIVLPTLSSTVMNAFTPCSQSGTIWPHLWATLFEILLGFVAWLYRGLVVGAMISLIPAFERLVYPYLVALQTLPKIAIAPLFIIWFGYGLTSKRSSLRRSFASSLSSLALSRDFIQRIRISWT